MPGWKRDAESLRALVMESNAKKREHCWSGSPGAYCVDCGAEDRVELCIATHDQENCNWQEHTNTPCMGTAPHAPWCVTQQVCDCGAIK